MNHTFFHDIVFRGVDIQAEVTFDIEDVGVMMQPNERLAAVIKGVRRGELDLLSELRQTDEGNETLDHLEEVAFMRWLDQRDVTRWGGETV